MKTLVVEMIRKAGSDSNSIKTMLIQESNHGHAVSSKGFESTIKEASKFIIDNYKSGSFNKLIIDRTGIGLGLIDTIIGDLKGLGMKYDQKTGEIKQLSEGDKLKEILKEAIKQRNSLDMISFRNYDVEKFYQDSIKKIELLEELIKLSQ